MALPTRRLHRAALLLVIGAVVLAVVSGIGLIWVVSQTDTGMLCDRGLYGADRPTACSVYDAPFWLFGVAFAIAAVAAATFAASLLPHGGTSRSL